MTTERTEIAGDKTASPECWRHYYGAREYVCNCPGRTDDTGREKKFRVAVA